ncbi:hypothetical protein GCM10025787_38290 [Saccharopolyspora rosea]
MSEPTSEKEGAAWRAREHPRVRGARQVHGMFVVPEEGNIPAYVGPTTCPTSSTGSAREHPRMRGADTC